MNAKSSKGSLRTLALISAVDGSKPGSQMTDVDEPEPFHVPTYDALTVVYTVPVLSMSRGSAEV